MADKINGFSSNFNLDDRDYISLEEALNNLTIVEPTKNCVSLLQEYLVRRNFREPTYEYNMMPDTTFSSKVSYQGPLTGIGYGCSKKEAKLEAAKSLYTILTNNVFGTTITNNNRETYINELNSSTSSTSSTRSSNNTSLIQTESNKNDIDNPIGLLQEICVQQSWAQPKYESENECGLQHDKVFTISCIVLQYFVTGTGKTKKIAKKKAAEKMCRYLKTSFIDIKQTKNLICVD